MALPKNDTHAHISQKKARQAAEAAGLNADGLKFYKSGMMWGWCSKDLAEVSKGADEAPVAAEGVDSTVDDVQGEQPKVPFSAGVSNLVAALTDLKEGIAEAIAPAPAATPTPRLVILDVVGTFSPAEGAKMARILSAKTGQTVTIRLAANNDVLDHVKPPEHVWTYTDSAGRQHFPSDQQFQFILLCTRPEGATVAQLKAAIPSNTPKNWMLMGEAVEKFGFRFDFEFRKINRLASEKVFRLYPAEAAAA